METSGTNIGDEMFAQSHPASWGNPMWEERDVSAGGIMPGEGQLLYGLVRALQPIMILEVGTSHGYSTLHLAQACKDNGFGYVYTIEIDEGRRKDAVKNIANAGLIEFILPVDNLEATRFVDNFDFVFLDAGHTAQELQSYLPYCKGAKTIVIHDAAYQNHARQVMSDEYHVVLLPNTSYAGIAICQKR